MQSIKMPVKESETDSTHFTLTEISFFNCNLELAFAQL
jgi:hypothetical protein